MSRRERRGETAWTTARIPVEAHEELEEILEAVSAKGTGVLPSPLDVFAAEEQAKTGTKTMTRGVVVRVALRYLRMAVLGDGDGSVAGEE